MRGKNMKRKDTENLYRLQKIVGGAFFVMMAFSLSACGNAPLALLDKMQAGVNQVKESSYKASAISIDNYCDKVPFSQRQKLRQNVNAYTEKGDIFIKCEDDK